MRQLEKRVGSLESGRADRAMSLAHVPDEALDRMEAILARSPLDMDPGEVAFFQSYGFLNDIDVGSGTIRDWVALGDEIQVMAPQEHQGRN